MINEKSPEDHYEEIIQVDTREYEKKKKTFDEWVTIGLLKKENQKERLEFLNKKRIHYVPYVKNQTTRIYSSSEILVCISGTTKGILYKIKGKQILTRDELYQKGMSWKLNRSKYLVFDLYPIPEEIEINPEIVPINFRYTTKGALELYKSKKFQDANALYINSSHAYKLYTLLSRRMIDFKISWSDNNLDEIIFFIHNEKIKVKSGSYKLMSNESKEINLNDIVSQITK